MKWRQFKKSRKQVEANPLPVCAALTPAHRRYERYVTTRRGSACLWRWRDWQFEQRMMTREEREA